MLKRKTNHLFGTTIGHWLIKGGLIVLTTAMIAACTTTHTTERQLRETTGVHIMEADKQHTAAGQHEPSRRTSAEGRLLARPHTLDVQHIKEKTRITQRGTQPLRLEKKRDGLLYVPASYRAGRRVPLVLMLHGAGGDAQQSLRVLQELAD